MGSVFGASLSKTWEMKIIMIKWTVGIVICFHPATFLMMRHTDIQNFAD
jgi:hypothetical protein